MNDHQYLKAKTRHSKASPPCTSYHELQEVNAGGNTYLETHKVRLYPPSDPTGDPAKSTNFISTAQDFYETIKRARRFSMQYRYVDSHGLYCGGYTRYVCKAMFPA